MNIHDQIQSLFIISFLISDPFHAQRSFAALKIRIYEVSSHSKFFFIQLVILYNNKVVNSIEIATFFVNNSIRLCSFTLNMGQIIYELQIKYKRIIEYS